MQAFFVLVGSITTMTHLLFLDLKYPDVRERWEETLRGGALMQVT